LGGFKAQGRTAESAWELMLDGQAVEEAGAFSLLLEAVPPEAEIFKRYIILHLESILSNTQAMELDVLRIRLCLCKIKYGASTCSPLF